jgi:hypothetical protein
MWIVSLLLLIVLGVLGIASAVRGKRPELDGALRQLEGVEAWIGVVGFAWALLGIVQWVLAIGALAAAPVAMLIGLASLAVILALSLLLALPLLRGWVGAAQGAKLAEASAKLAPFKTTLGALCLVSAAYSLVRFVV